MSTSKVLHPEVPEGNASSYTRFIPREEVRSFAAWNPGALDARTGGQGAGTGTGTGQGTTPAGRAPFSVRAGVAGQPAAANPGGAPAAAAPQAGPRVMPLHDLHAPPATKEDVAPAEPPVDVEAVKAQARKTGYEDGYRDGLAALEAFKAAQASQMAAFMSDRVGAVVQDLQQRLELLEQQLSGRVARVAIELARQVARSELAQRPELVVDVAEQALAALLSSAREVTLRLNPHDLALVQTSLAEVLTTRGARLVADPTLTPGGCLVESDIAVVDASVEARWHKACAAMGTDLPWEEHGGGEA